MKFVFLILEYVPHQICIIEEALKDNNNHVFACSVNEKYDISTCFNERFQNVLLDKFSVNELVNQITLFNPDVIVVGGWAYKKYNKIASIFRKKNTIPIVAYSDTQWRGDWTQHINCLISPLYLKSIFTHLWVAGVYQYEYARKLGFKKSNIIFNALSCDVQLFQNLSLSNKQFDYPKNFIYIGRFSTEKGLNYLLDAWGGIEDKKGWTLTLIGEGPLRNSFINEKNVIIKDFMSHHDLLKEINNSGCFVMPSIYEPWALVIHEAAAAGLPIICTEICGAAPHFVIDNYNGYKVKSKESLDLKKAIQKIILLDKNELLQYSNRSRALAKSIRPEIGLANLVGLIS